ncbi:helix-turn-helix domain-containing protein [Roseivirga sp.]|uniref:helix-turn-helix domain-containing protein n=1 Tax=Roseivirga sp. TaxID=1964215 RepID=UPI003B51ABDB
MKLSEKITKPKKLNGLSRADLVTATGISKDAISKYERGDTPSVEYAKRIADALGVALDYHLVSDSDEQEVIDRETLNRVRAIQGMPEQEQDKIFSVIDALIRDYKTKQAYS